MKLTKRAWAVILAAVLSSALWSCDNKKSSESGAAEESSSAITETTSETTSPSQENTEAAATTSSSASTAESTTLTTSAGTTTTSAAETTAPAATEAPQAPTKAVKKGYDSSFEAAKAYYNAYLTGNADAVYDMLCEEEIEAYHSYLRSTDLLEGKNPQVVFKRSNVISAIKQSIRRYMIS